MKAAILDEKGKLTGASVNWKLRTIQNMTQNVKGLRKKSLGGVSSLMSENVWHRESDP